MSINLKAITSCIGYEQITSLATPTALNAPSTDANGLSCRPSFAMITSEGAAVSTVRGRPLPRGRCDSVRSGAVRGKGASLQGFRRDKAATSAVQEKTCAVKKQK